MNGWVSQALTTDHITDGFRCGQPALDDWLRVHALRAQGSSTARTYVWTPASEATVQAYYTIAPTQVRREDVSRSMSGGVAVVPAYLLARLALNDSLHGQGLGSELLIDALQMIVAASATAAGRLIIVDAIDEAAEAFYRHHDFTSIAGTRRLCMKVATARTAMSM